MAENYSTQAQSAPQPPKSGYGFLVQVLDNLDDAPLLETLKSYHKTGRPGYNPRAMYRAYCAKFVLKIRYNNQLVERLRGSRKLRDVCGFGDEVPSESALSRFVSRLANHQDLIEQSLVKVTNQLRDLVPTVKRRKNRQPQPLPPLGAVLAIDSTLFLTYSNPNRPVVSDPDARWGVKHSSRTKEGDTEWGFGYKMHLVSDATHGVPLAFTITPANVNDTTQLEPVMSKLLDAYPWIEPGCLLADRGYDSEPNHRYLLKQNIIPIIHIRKPTAEDGLYDGLYNAEGRPVCLGQQPMEYIKTDQTTGHHLFRCSPQGCPLKQEGTKAITHCDSECWQPPDDNPRVIGPLPRFSRAWKRLYAQRMSVERVFRSFKHSRALDGHCVRGMRKITLHATLTAITFQVTALARLQAKDPEQMRRMTVKVA